MTGQVRHRCLGPLLPGGPRPSWTGGKNTPPVEPATRTPPLPVPEISVTGAGSPRDTVAPHSPSGSSVEHDLPRDQTGPGRVHPVVPSHDRVQVVGVAEVAAADPAQISQEPGHERRDTRMITKMTPSPCRSPAIHRGPGHMAETVTSSPIRPGLQLRKRTSTIIKRPGSAAALRRRRTGVGAVLSPEPMPASRVFRRRSFGNHVVHVRGAETPPWSGFATGAVPSAHAGPSDRSRTAGGSVGRTTAEVGGARSERPRSPRALRCAPQGSPGPGAASIRAR